MSYQEPAPSGCGLTASEIDPAHYAIVPSDDQQALVFRSIRAIKPQWLVSHGAASITPERRTPKGIRPMIWIRLNETKSAVVFEVTLHTGQGVQVHVPFESWRLATCEPEAVRAAIQKAYLSLLRHKPDPGIVKPGMISLKVLSKYDPQHRAPVQTLEYSNPRQISIDSNSAQASLDSSRLPSPPKTGESLHTSFRSQGPSTPQSHSHPQSTSQPLPLHPPVRPNVFARLNAGPNLNGGSQSPPSSPLHHSPFVTINHNGQQPYLRVRQAPGSGAGFDPYAARYVSSVTGNPDASMESTLPSVL